MTITADSAVMVGVEHGHSIRLTDADADVSDGRRGADNPHDLGRAGSIGRSRYLAKLDAMILEAVAAGASSVQIAVRLHLSRQAVDYHIKGMLRMLNAVNRPELVSKACSVGMLDLATWPPKVPSDHVKDL